MADATPDRLGHVHLKVRELDPAVAFYTDVLALDVRERQGQYAFLSWGQRHHDVALQAVGPDAGGPGRGVGLYHAAFEVESREALASSHERLQERGVRVSPVDHGISKALYFSDPDGNGLELYLDTRDEEEEGWNGENESFEPLALTGE